MFATIRRYEGVDPARTSEITGKVNETLIPELSKLDGFAGYYLIEGTNGVLSSLGLFERQEQVDESTKLVAKWITDEHQGRCSQRPYGRVRLARTYSALPRRA
jgi:hypothetical protein